MKNFYVVRMSEDGGGVEADYHEWVRKSNFSCQYRIFVLMGNITKVEEMCILEE